MNKLVKVRACFRCREYVRIFDDNPKSQTTEKIFLNFHPKHPTQIIGDEDTINFLKEAGYTEFKVQQFGDLVV